jgi:hypothetical protein
MVKLRQEKRCDVCQYGHGIAKKGAGKVSRVKLRQEKRCGVGQYGKASLSRVREGQDS